MKVYIPREAKKEIDDLKDKEIRNKRVGFNPNHTNYEKRK